MPFVNIISPLPLTYPAHSPSPRGPHLPAHGRRIDRVAAHQIGDLRVELASGRDIRIASTISSIICPLPPTPTASYTIPNTNQSLTRKAAPHAERYRHHHHPADHPAQRSASSLRAPLRRLQTLTTAAKYPDTLLDACLAFFRAVFAGCASLALVRQVIGEAEELDLSERLPVGWVALPAVVKAVIAGCAVETARMAVG